MFKTRLNFHGTETLVHLATAKDAAHLNYYYGCHRTQKVEPRVALTLATEPPGRAFFMSMRDEGVVKRIELDLGNGPELYEQFRMRAIRPTPLPPICLPSIRGDLVLSHGAAVDIEGAGSVLIRGASGAGKSMILLGLGMVRPCRFLSDDLILADREGGILPLFRPIGVRACNLQFLGKRIGSIVQESLAIRTGSGTTYMVRPVDLMPLAPSKPHRPKLVIFLERGQGFESSVMVRSSGFAQLRLRFDPQKYLTGAVGAVLGALAQLRAAEP